MIAGLFKALFLTAGPGIIVFVLAQFMPNRKWLTVYSLAFGGLVLYLYLKIYSATSVEDAQGWVFSHALVHCLSAIGALGIFIKFRKLERLV